MKEVHTCFSAVELIQMSTFKYAGYFVKTGKCLNQKTKINNSKVCRLVQQPTPLRCVPSTSVSQSASVSKCPLCSTWFGYYEQ